MLTKYSDNENLPMKNKDDEFKKIVYDNTDRIRRICGYYTNNTEDQKDMFQEILINVWNSLESFRGASSVNTWVYRIAVNTALGFVGKAFKQMKLIVRTDTQNLSALLADESHHETLEREFKFAQLQVELNQLSVIDKALISLVLEGLTSREIADVIGITESNVKVKIHRIKDHLKTKLSIHNDE
jgi:RNA polymerase sigma-70 factor (ECF subfamily)